MFTWMTLKILPDKRDINTESETDDEEAMRGVMMCSEIRIERRYISQMMLLP